MRLRLLGALATFGAFLQAALATQLRHTQPSADASDAAKAFAATESKRLSLLSSATQQVLAAPGVEQDPLFHKTLHKVSAQLQESASILAKWGTDYARNSDANEMAVGFAEQGAAYQVADLKRQLRKAIEDDQEAQLEQPKKLAALAKKITGLRSQLNQLIVEEARQKVPPASQSPRPATALISDAWPRPPKNASKAEMGLFMHGSKMRVSAEQQDEEERDHLAQLESRFTSLEKQVKDAEVTVAAAHSRTAQAREETKVES